MRFAFIVQLLQSDSRKAGEGTLLSMSTHFLVVSQQFFLHQQSGIISILAIVYMLFDCQLVGPCPYTITR